MSGNLAHLSTKTYIILWIKSEHFYNLDHFQTNMMIIHYFNVFFPVLSKLLHSDNCMQTTDLALCQTIDVQCSCARVALP